MKYTIIPLVLCLLFISTRTSAQADRWQQRAEYEMNIDFDVDKHQFTGTQKLVYFNNSPDTLGRVFYHLYFNPRGIYYYNFDTNFNRAFLLFKFDYFSSYYMCYYSLE